jgi:uncharacterized protein YrrD
MHFKMGADVHTADGTHVGRVKSVVVTPNTQEVIGLVVERGFLFTEEKVLPFSWVDRVEADDNHRVILTKLKHNFDSLPPFEEKLYVPREEFDQANVDNAIIPAYYPYGAPGYYPSYFASGFVAADPNVDPDYVQTTIENIPDDAVAVKTGARVFSSDDKNVGSIEQVFTSDSGRATHILISKGWFFTTRKLVPTSWISTTTENEVNLSVSSGMLDRLPDYDTYDWRVREMR